MYQAAKFGLEGYSESLAAEVAAHGIKVTFIEPTRMTPTGFTGPKSRCSQSGL